MEKGHTSYFSERNHEGKIAAYNGFQDVGDFRRFLMSFPVMELYYFLKAGLLY